METLNSRELNYFIIIGIGDVALLYLPDNKIIEFDQLKSDLDKIVNNDMIKTITIDLGRYMNAYPNYYNDVKNILYFLNELNIDESKKIEIKIFNDIEFIKLKDEIKIPPNIAHLIEIQYFLAYKISLLDILKVENVLELIAEDIISLNLSPLEEYLACFLIVTNYKLPKDGPSWRSRKIDFTLLDNDYMVCAGYTNFMIRLVNKLNKLKKANAINITDFSVSVRDPNKLPNENIVGFHSRLLTSIWDDKYNLHGKRWISDPTLAVRNKGELSKAITTEAIDKKSLEYITDFGRYVLMSYYREETWNFEDEENIWKIDRVNIDESDESFGKEIPTSVILEALKNVIDKVFVNEQPKKI